MLVAICKFMHVLMNACKPAMNKNTINNKSFKGKVLQVLQISTVAILGNFNFQGCCILYFFANIFSKMLYCIRLALQNFSSS